MSMTLSNAHLDNGLIRDVKISAGSDSDELTTDDEVEAGWGVEFGRRSATRERGFGS